MPEYSQGKIYTIRNRTNDTHVYVGSTCQSLAMRMAEHRRTSRKEKNKNSIFYRTVAGDWSNWVIELYEDFPCDRKEQLKKREGEVQREIATLNMRIEDRTRQEWNKDNAETMTEYHKQYRQVNAKVLAEKYKQWRQNNVEKQRQYYQENLKAMTEKNKQYQINNREKRTLYKRAYIAKKKAEKEQQQQQQ